MEEKIKKILSILRTMTLDELDELIFFLCHHKRKK